MNVIVVGAGNAGRPVARLLNYAGHTVKITDPKKIEDFHMDVQKTLRLMESEGANIRKIFLNGCENFFSKSGIAKSLCCFHNLYRIHVKSIDMTTALQLLQHF